MKIRTRGNKNADETTDIVFTIKSTNQCYRATMARLNMFTKNSSDHQNKWQLFFEILLRLIE